MRWARGACTRAVARPLVLPPLCCWPGVLIPAAPACARPAGHQRGRDPPGHLLQGSVSVCCSLMGARHIASAQPPPPPPPPPVAAADMLLLPCPPHRVPGAGGAGGVRPGPGRGGPGARSGEGAWVLGRRGEGCLPPVRRAVASWRSCRMPHTAVALPTSAGQGGHQRGPAHDWGGPVIRRHRRGPPGATMRVARSWVLVHRRGPTSASSCCAGGSPPCRHGSW